MLKSGTVTLRKFLISLMEEADGEENEEDEEDEEAKIQHLKEVSTNS